MNNPNAWYHVYLLRLWKAGRTGEWRASLEDPRTGERRGFASLERLFLFLCAQAQSESRQKTGPDILIEGGQK